jgi:putative nucleotidyltransferase with HDIG domain
MSTAAEAFVEDARDLPVMAPVAAQVMKKAEDPDTDIKDLTTLISRDASLTVRVLKIANSSFYSMPRKIESMQQAIVLLGYSTLRSVVVAASMKDVFARFGLAERLLWEHAVAAGVASSIVAREVGGLRGEECFVAGLVHDVGKLLMHSNAEAQYQEVMRQVYGDERETIEAERSVFGFDHAQVGSLVLSKWDLPQSLAAAIGAHHDPASAPDEVRSIAAVLQVADQMCLREGHGRRKPDPELDPCASTGAEILGITEMDPQALCEEFGRAYQEEREVLG